MNHGGDRTTTGPGTAEALLAVVRAFEEADLPYMVVGAFAVMVHGVPRTSADIDVVLHMPFDRRDDVRPLVEELGTGSVDERRDPQWGQRLVTTLPVGLDLELFFTPEHPWYDQEFERRVVREVRGQPIPFLSPEDLILRKLVNTRLRRKHDLDDAIGVAKVQGKDLDIAYLREHCAAHRVCDVLEDVLVQAGLG